MPYVSEIISSCRRCCRSEIEEVNFEVKFLSIVPPSRYINLVNRTMRDANEEIIKDIRVITTMLGTGAIV